MLDLVQYIIKIKMGKFDFVSFEDRYEVVVVELVKVKDVGKMLFKCFKEKVKIISLMDVLCESVKLQCKIKIQFKIICKVG